MRVTSAGWQQIESSLMMYTTKSHHIPAHKHTFKGLSTSKLTNYLYCGAACWRDSRCWRSSRSRSCSSSRSCRCLSRSSSIRARSARILSLSSRIFSILATSTSRPLASNIIWNGTLFIISNQNFPFYIYKTIQQLPWLIFSRSLSSSLIISFCKYRSVQPAACVIFQVKQQLQTVFWPDIWCNHQ